MAQKKLKRSESFLGVHFDFHAREDCKEMGKTVTHEMIDAIIETVGPDYLQCDCKGHAGLSSYPTKVGNPVPAFTKDQLKIWREATEKRGVALYMHYSGVWDSTVVRQYPEWAVVKADGTKDDRMTSTFGPYVDEILLPQLKELSDEYGVDGVWIDGDCWATTQDYRDEAIERFQKQYGVRDVPREPDDDLFLEYTEMCRQAFRDYLTHYVEEMHRHNPEFQVASNWAYSSQMPEPVTIDVDFISGDFSLQDSVNSARYEGRCMQRQGKPWDLMAWAFSCRFGDWNNCTKSIPQLKQEAAVVLALGGGFQAYFKQKRDGSIFPWEMRLMGAVAEFARERQPFCHGGEAVPQVALLYSGSAFYRKNTKLFGGGWGNENLVAMRGVLHALLDSQQVVEVCMEHHLKGRMGEYGLIVVPEWGYLDPSFKEELAEYARAGGSLMLVGPDSARLFEKELGVTLLGDRAGTDKRWLDYGDWVAGFIGRYERIPVDADVKVIARHYADNDPDAGAGEPAAFITDFGSGKIGAVLFEIGKQYINGSTPTFRKILGGMSNLLFETPIATVTGSQYVDVTVSRKDDTLMVHLVNTAGPHSDSDVYVYDEIPMVGPLEVSVNVAERPKSVTLQPGDRNIDWNYESGTLSLTVERLEIYDIVVIE